VIKLIIFYISNDFKSKIKGIKVLLILEMQFHCLLMMSSFMTRPKNSQSFE